MKESFWRVLALAVLGAALLFFLAGRFNVVSTGMGTILLLLLLTERPAPGATTLDRCAWASIFGLLPLTAVGRLLVPVWAALPFHFARELLVSWLVLCLPGWWVSRTAASGG